MSKVCKAWLLVILIINTISAIVSLLVGFLNPLSWVSTMIVVVYVIGIILLLFKLKKVGFHLMIAAQVMGLIVNLNLGDRFLSALISSALPLLITYLFLKRDWAQLR